MDDVTIPHDAVTDAVPDTPGTPPDLTAFKHAFQRHAAGTVVITTITHDGEPVGFTATSLASLSATPPLATFNMARTSHSWRTVATAPRVAIQMLGAANQHIAEAMAGAREQRFTAVQWQTGPHGLPIIADVTAWMIARIVKRIPVHNNAIVVAQIEQGIVQHDDFPLIYHARMYSPYPTVRAVSNEPLNPPRFPGLNRD